MHEDRIAIAHARVARALAALLGAALASLMAYYAARIGAAAVCLPGRSAEAAIAALQQERDAAIRALRQSHRHQRDHALRTIRLRRKKWFRLAYRPAPERTGAPARSPDRRRTHHYP